jgi:hypothetical protein
LSPAVKNAHRGPVLWPEVRRMESPMTDTAAIPRETVSRAAEELSVPLTIGAEAYVSEDYARAERDKLWRKVWLQAGRVE